MSEMNRMNGKGIWKFYEEFHIFSTTYQTAMRCKDFHAELSTLKSPKVTYRTETN